jgi:diaminohydroxyphosphoribosylaminopyrimidine deaminase/5-amino-6-(5-phosphoribosylamino)uracil reductase
LEALLLELGARGLNEVLVEGGGELLASFLAEGLVDELACSVAPMVIGGVGAPTPVGGAGAERLLEAAKLAIRDVVRRGPDVWLTARPVGAPEPGGPVDV